MCENKFILAIREVMSQLYQVDRSQMMDVCNE